MIVCTTPERIIPAHTTKLYRYEELSAEAKAHALDEWNSNADYGLYNVSAEDESTWENIYEALEWLDNQIAINWEIDAYDNIYIRIKDHDIELDPYGLYVPAPLKTPGLWCECDIADAYNAILPTLRIATFAYGEAHYWFEETQSEAEEDKASDLMESAADAYENALDRFAEAISKALTKDAEADMDYHRSEEYFAEIATSCSDLWFDAQGNQEDIDGFEHELDGELWNLSDQLDAENRGEQVYF